MPGTDLNAYDCTAFKKENLTAYAWVFLQVIGIQTLPLRFKKLNFLEALAPVRLQQK